MIAVVTGPPGYGKTHLFGRIEHLVGHEVFFVFVPDFSDETPPLDHIRRYVVESLFDAPAGSSSPLETALARWCQPAFAEYFSNLTPTLATRHEALGRRLADSPDAVLEVVRQVKSLSSFLKLADSFVQVIPEDAGIVRALALGWSPAPWSGTARRWLQGQDLPDADREALGLGEDPPAAIDVLRVVPALFGFDRPMIICCDQIEGVLKGKNEDAINQLSSALMTLLGSVPTQIVLNCFLDSWNEFLKSAFSSFNMRVRQPIFQLEPMKPDQAIRLVTNRLNSWPGRSLDNPPTWPFVEESIDRFVRHEAPTPRGLIQTCGTRFEEWAANEQEGLIDLMDDKVVVVDLSAAFLQEWNRELAAIAKDSKRSASYLSQERLYLGILEALKLAHSAQRLREFGGVRIVDLSDKVIKPTPATRPGARLELAGKPGEGSQAVVVALTTLEASRSFGPYLKALLNASAEPEAGVLLIHPRRDLDLGPAARGTFEKAQKDGKLRFMPLEDHPLTAHATECLATMLDRAVAREFVINGVALSPGDCRDLVIKTGVIDNLELFKMLGRWKRTGAVAAAPIVPTARLQSGPSAIPAVPAPTGPTPVNPEPPRPIAAPETRPPDANASAANTIPWAEKMLAGAVRKLNLLGASVEPDGFEIGPTFARLRVRPVGKTNFKGVCNKAVDLRISLGLEVVPIVGSQAGCISIDVQRPDRATVSIATALAGAPPKLEGQPAFPVGVDVGGESHWLNLADPSDCHLLVAGTTGSGKSEFLRSLIASLALRLEPRQLQFVLIDPKRVTFNLRSSGPYLKSPVAYNLEEALPLIEGCMAEMDRRYRLLEDRKLANVADLPADLLPRIVLIIDEFASFLEDKDSKKVVTALLKRIGAMARAAGIHLILSTQRPDKDVITPLLRENLPGRIALRVASKAGSDLILGAPDAENLLGKGDLFWKRGGELLRLQSPYVPQEELERALRCVT
jgi:hypothetical protein